MMKEFNVRFYFDYGDGIPKTAIRGVLNFLSYINNPVKGVKFYVMPKSEEIFVPLYIDVGRGEDEDFYTLMRGDKHFFQPKIEYND